MPIDKLWALHEVISETLAARLAAQKRLLEERLNLLSNQASAQLKPLSAGLIPCAAEVPQSGEPS
jgi:hypothetical protein